MLGSQQAKIIGILRIEYEKNPQKFFTIREIAYTTIATILKRLSEQEKVTHFEESNKHFFQFKDIESLVSENLLSIFINAFGTKGLASLIEKGKKLTKDDIKDLTDTIDD